jgi:hypothetical protein
LIARGFLNQSNRAKKRKRSMKHFPRRVKRNFSGKVSIRNLSRGEELSESRDFGFFYGMMTQQRGKKKKEIGTKKKQRKNQKNALK